MLKKHTRDITVFSFCKEATLITAKRRFCIFLNILISGIILESQALVNLTFLHVYKFISPCT